MPILGPWKVILHHSKLKAVEEAVSMQLQEEQEEGGDLEANV